MNSSLKTIPLDEAFWFQEGPGVRKWQFKNEGVKLLNVGNITTDGRIDLSKTDRHLSLEEVQSKYSHFLVDAGDLVIASSGISFDDDGYLRTKIAFVESKHLPLCMNTSTIRFKPKNDEFSLNYLKHWFQSAEFRSQVSKRVTGSAQLNFGPSHLKEMMISIPGLEDQRRIAGMLDKAEEIRRKREAALDVADSLLAATFLEMFGDPVSNPNGHQTRTLGDVASFISGGTPSKKRADYWDGNFPWVSPKDMKVDLICDAQDHVSENAFFETSLKQIPPNTPLIVVRGMILAHTVPIALTQREVAINQDMKAVMFNSEIDPVFGLWNLKVLHNRILSQVDAAAHGTKRIDTSRLQALPIMVPGDNLQSEFVAVTRKFAEMRVRLSTSLNDASQMFDALSQRAFRGEL